MTRFKNDEEMFTYLLRKSRKELVLEIKAEVLEELKNHFSKLGASIRYLTSNEVCETYRISPAVLNRYVNDGLKYSSKGYKCKRLFKNEDVVNFLNGGNYVG